MPGEKVSFRLLQGEKDLADQDWETDFPTETTTMAFEKAQVDVTGLLGDLFSATNLAQWDLIKLAQADVPEIRAGAAADIRDQTMLAKIATEDKVSDVRMAAVKNLMDQDILARIVADDEYPAVRIAAINNLTDQVLLAKIAKDDKDDQIQKAATDRLKELGVPSP
jgi:hypothetical protein